MGLADPHQAVQPLTRVRLDGERYRRDPEVEAQIGRSILLSATALKATASAAEKSSPDYLKEECLVHLMRAAARRADEHTLNVAAELLVRRCRGWATRKFRVLGVAPADLDDAYEDLITTVMSSILADDDRGDFYEVRFWTALKRQLLKVFEPYNRRRQLEGRHESLSAPIAADGDGADGHACLGDTIPARQNELEEIDRQEQTAEAIKSIRDTRHRDAFVLHYCEGWQIESKEGAEPCLAKLFKVSPRTVRNWLRAAASDVAASRATRGTVARSQP